MKQTRASITLCFALVALACVVTGCSTTQSAAEVDWQSRGLNSRFEDDKVRDFLPDAGLQSSSDSLGLNDWAVMRQNCYTLSLQKNDIFIVPKSWSNPPPTAH